MQHPESRTFEMPQAVEAEAGLLGAILSDASLLRIFGSRLRPEFFFDIRHALIFKGMMALDESGTHVSAVTITDWLRQQTVLEKVGVTYIAELLNLVATTDFAHVQRYMQIVADRYLQRSLVNFGRELVADGTRTSNPHELIRLSIDALARMNGSVGMGDQRMLQAALSGSLMVERNVPQPAEIIKGGIMSEATFVLLYGKPGLGKTWLALQMALAIASGQPWLGLATEQRRVGLIELELSEYFIRERLLGLTQDMPEAQIGLENIEIICRPNYTAMVDLTEISSRDGIINWIKERDLGVVIFDAMSRMHTGDENNAQEMGQILGAIEFIKEETRCAVSGIHHEPKESRQQRAVSDLDAARGSARFQSDPQTMMRLKEKYGQKLLVFAKQNLGNPLEPIYLERKEHGFSVMSTPRDPVNVGRRNQDRIEQILLERAREGITQVEIQKLTGLGHATLRKHLSEIATEKHHIWYHKSYGATISDPLFAQDEIESAQEADA